MRDNSPPKDAYYYLAQLRRCEARVAAWADAEVTTENAGQLRDAIGYIDGLAKDAEKARKAIKEPYLESGRKVDASFKPVSALAESLCAPLKLSLKRLLIAEEARKREALEAAQREAEAKARAAAALANDEFVGDHLAKEANEAARQARQAERLASHTAVAGETHDRRMSLRTYHKARITDYVALVTYYAAHPDVVSLCERLANAQIRASKGEVSIPGIEVVEDRRIA